MCAVHLADDVCVFAPKLEQSTDLPQDHIIDIVPTRSRGDRQTTSSHQSCLIEEMIYDRCADRTEVVLCVVCYNSSLSTVYHHYHHHVYLLK